MVGHSVDGIEKTGQLIGKKLKFDLLSISYTQI